MSNAADAHLMRFAPQISGQVVAAHPAGNPRVHAGHARVEIDPGDAQAALHKALAP